MFTSLFKSRRGKLDLLSSECIAVSLVSGKVDDNYHYWKVAEDGRVSKLVEGKIKLTANESLWVVPHQIELMAPLAGVNCQLHFKINLVFDGEQSEQALLTAMRYFGDNSKEDLVYLTTLSQDILTWIQQDLTLRLAPGFTEAELALFSRDLSDVLNQRTGFSIKILKPVARMVVSREVPLQQPAIMLSAISELIESVCHCFEQLDKSYDHLWRLVYKADRERGFHSTFRDLSQKHRPAVSKIKLSYLNNALWLKERLMPEQQHSLLLTLTQLLEQLQLIESRVEEICLDVEELTSYELQVFIKEEQKAVALLDQVLQQGG